MTDAEATVSYAYNDVNLVARLTEPGGNVTSFAYDDDDTSTTYPNGVVQTVGYDASDRLTSIVGTKGTATLTSFSYDYAKAGEDTGLARASPTRTTTRPPPPTIRGQPQLRDPQRGDHHR